MVRKILKINKKNLFILFLQIKYIKTFIKILTSFFKSKKIKFFQLRLKKIFKKKILIGKKIKKICKKNKVKFIINDDPYLTKKVNADGCHLGQKDMNIKDAKKIIKK